MTAGFNTSRVTDLCCKMLCVTSRWVAQGGGEVVGRTAQDTGSQASPCPL